MDFFTTTTKKASYILEYIQKKLRCDSLRLSREAEVLSSSVGESREVFKAEKEKRVQEFLILNYYSPKQPRMDKSQL